MYLTVKTYGLLDNYAALILPVLTNPFSMIVLRQFFMGIPGELVDSARIDGANDLQILVRMVLPLSKTVIAVIALFYAVAYWNDFFSALLYLNHSAMWPLSLVLRARAGENAPVPSAAIVVAILPILAVYPFLQRYFTRGVLSGAIKG